MIGGGGLDRCTGREKKQTHTKVDTYTYIYTYTSRSYGRETHAKFLYNSFTSENKCAVLSHNMSFFLVFNIRKKKKIKRTDLLLAHFFSGCMIGTKYHRKSHILDMRRLICIDTHIHIYTMHRSVAMNIVPKFFVKVVGVCVSGVHFTYIVCSQKKSSLHLQIFSVVAPSIFFQRMSLLYIFFYAP